MLAKYFNAQTLAHVALAALPYIATSLAHMPGAYGVIGSALLQLFALYRPAPKS